MKKLTAIVFLITNLFYITSSFGEEHLMVLWDVASQNFKCQQLREHNLEKLAEIQSPESIADKDINAVSYILFSNQVAPSVTLRLGDPTNRNWYREASRKANETFANYYSEYSQLLSHSSRDVVGALLEAFKIAEEYPRETFEIHVFSAALQRVGKWDDLKEIIGRDYLRIPENVEAVYFHASVGTCLPDSALEKRLWEKKIRELWEGHIKPESKVFWNY